MDTTAGIQVVKIESASASDDGQGILISFDIGQEAPLNLVIPADDAMGLMSALSAASGDAARTRSDDPNIKHVLPAESCEVGTEPGAQMIVFSWRLAGGMELSFQVPRNDATRLYEGLGSTLGVTQMTAPPETLRH